MIANVTVRSHIEAIHTRAERTLKGKAAVSIGLALRQNATLLFADHADVRDSLARLVPDKSFNNRGRLYIAVRKQAQQ
jgi:hypothetical protein